MANTSPDTATVAVAANTPPPPPPPNSQETRKCFTSWLRSRNSKEPFTSKKRFEYRIWLSVPDEPIIGNVEEKQKKRKQ